MSQGRYNTVKHGVGKFMIGDRVIAQGKVKREAGTFTCRLSSCEKHTSSDL